MHHICRLLAGIKCYLDCVSFMHSCKRGENLVRLAGISLTNLMILI